MNQFQHSSRCRHLPAAQKGRSVSPPSGAPATLYHGQTYTHGTSRGMARLWTRGYAPGRVTSVRSRVSVSLQRTCRRLGTNLDGGLFSRECCTNSLANQFLVAERNPNRVTQRHQCHFENPFASSTYALKPTQERGQGRGYVERELGRFIQGQRSAVDD